MMQNKEITLICTPLKFYAPLDEDALFEWLNKIECIESYKGIGEELHIYLKTSSITRREAWNLRGVFKRYKFKNREQLEIFTIID